MALTSAEKMKAYRQRLRENGGKTFAIDIEGEKLKFVSFMAGGDKTESEILRVILTGALDRWVEVRVKALQLFEAGASNEEVDRFFADNRIQPVADIADYFPITPIEGNSDEN